MIGKILVMCILLLPIAGAIIAYIIGTKSKKGRDIFNILLTGLEFLLVIILSRYIGHEGISIVVPDVMAEGLYLKIDAFRYIFVWLTSFIWFITTIYTTQYLIKYKNRNRYYFFYLITLSATIGVFISADMLNLFTFFEVMSLTSYVLIIHDEDKYAHEAGATYIAMAIIGGLILLMGLFLMYDYTGTLHIDELYYKMHELGSIKYTIAFLILTGFAVKAGMFPLHVWIPESYSAAPAPASAILSSILSKTGIFGIIIVSSFIMRGDYIISSTIFIFGLITMFIGGLLAIFQRHMKRVFAYSSMSQIGYMLVGIGLVGLLGDHSIQAVYGTLLHAINHSLIKALLFLCAGIIYMKTNEMSINFIRGYGQNKLLLKLLVLIGVLAITGMPGFSGFISKTFLHEALAQGHHLYNNTLFAIAEVMFAISSSFTVAYMLKIFITVFVEKNDKFEKDTKSYMTKTAALPITLLGLVIMVIGIKPQIVFPWISESLVLFNVEESIHPQLFTIYNIKTALAPIILGTLIYVFIIRGLLKKRSEGIYINPIPDWMNIEKSIYIPIIKGLYHIGITISHIMDIAIIKTADLVMFAFKKIGQIDIAKIKTADFVIATLKKNDQISMKTPLHGSTILTNIEDKKEDLAEIAHIKTQNLESALANMRYKLNSIVYGVFIFAISIVIILLMMMFDIF